MAAPLDLSLVGLHTFMSTHAGRDQVGKFVQYATRGIVGALTVSLTAFFLFGRFHYVLERRKMD